MLLPETNRSSVPYLASVTIQCSLVLLLAIPWTVQKLRNSASMQLPTMLTFQNLKPVDPVRTTQRNDARTSSLPALPTRARVFVPLLSSSGASASVTVGAPDVEFGAGGAAAIGLPVPLSNDTIANLIPAPIAPATPEPKVEAPSRVSVGGVVQAAKLIRRVQPVYPPLARQARVQGTVTLEAIIDADGSIRQLHVLGGNPMLIPNAVQAVQQWMYSPTVLNGKPVEVKTTIEVRFTLSDR